MTRAQRQLLADRAREILARTRESGKSGSDYVAPATVTVGTLQDLCQAAIELAQETE